MSSQLNTVFAPEAPTPTGPFIHAIKSDPHIYCSGQVGWDESKKQLAPGGIKAETKQALANLDYVLKAAGSSRDRVTKVNVFICDMGLFAEMNEVYGEFFGDHRPARTCVQVVATPVKGALVEIECIARI
ncbi:putative translation initiation inhibitor [Basidiobolus meristosporus CBS 931.73]|uniref:Putative translation initiation inhibitor n=1 Tax=Basidiobolus meristosporus CBS 931.73 TaxID=1314790 RepID=A0A1Y1XAP9_9FUNG|nr:putative translation initiation inhibitor [Basidiobolus meristosporus CBS 931.73]|eukprot:ORX82851.1 putative translation initiation inhibitor [Basidiobolus meristosporus CBS 931.73]